MIKPKCHCDEDRPLLVLALDPEKLRQYHPECEAAVTRGAVNYLGRWPADVLASFIAGTLVFATFVLFGIFTIILTIPSGERNRLSRNIEANDLPKFYFIKHENRTWNPEELCYIENTARTHKNFSVYLINLLADDKPEESDRNELVNSRYEFKSNSGRLPMEFFNQVDESMIRSRDAMAKLPEFNRNIKSIEVPLRRFFNGSRLANVSNRLSNEMIEMAAKLLILWNSPGVVLDPAVHPRLDFFNDLLCTFRDDCPKDSLVTMELNGYIQASSAPCQALLDHLIQQMATIKSPDQQFNLNKTIGDFCQSSSQCDGVRLLTNVTKTDYSLEKFDCPTILPGVVDREEIGNGQRETEKEIGVFYFN